MTTDKMTDERVAYVRMPEDLHRRLRVRAADEDRTYNEVMIDALKMYLKKMRAQES